jgi:hypothetical protein
MIVYAFPYYATSRKVAGSIPDEVTGFFCCPHAASCIMALGADSASNRNEYQEFSWGKEQPASAGLTSPPSVS